MGWISVYDKLPKFDNNTDVIVWCLVSNGGPHAEVISSCDMYDDILCPPDDVSHWMPLPEPPK